MSTLQGSDFTVHELKEGLRARGLPTAGSKAELIRRLDDGNPDVWTMLNMQLEAATCRAGASDSGGTGSVSATGVEVVEAREQGAASPAQSDDWDCAELALLRRERELLERERLLLQRERELSRTASVASTSVTGGGDIRGVKELLSEFDASENTFWRWKSQLELLRDTYRLDENATRILIGSRLRGRALTWFYSKTEHLTLSIRELLTEMGQMFDSRPGKLALRRKFEARMWRGDEPFCTYYHEKVILASRVPVAEDELLEYLIDGISSVRLRNQARLMRFSSRVDLLTAFESVVSEREDGKTGLAGGAGGARWRNGNGARAVAGGGSERAEGRRIDKELTAGERTGLPSAGSGQARGGCYRCGELGHVAARCGRPPTGRTCYRCGMVGHLAAGCPERGRSTGPGSTKGVTEIALAGASRSAVLPEPYVLNVGISAVDGRADYDRVDGAVVDSGSPISLIKSSKVSSELCSPTGEGAEQFHGINGSLLRIDGIFYGTVMIEGIRMKIKFYTVPDDAMSFDVLLGRDFLICPLIRVTLGKTIKVEAVGMDAVDEILAIESDGDPVNVRDKLQINEAVGEENIKKVCEAYEAGYLGSLRAESHEPDFEMNIVLKHEQPIYSRPRRLSFADREALRDILDGLLSEGIIRPSDSPYASPIVLVKKKSGSLRLCVDYRELNKVTVRDNFPTELIDDNIDRLRGKKYFSTLDLKDGFHHVRMHASSVKYTSFVTPLGQYEYLRMPFGLTNAPRVFQRFIHTIYASLVRENKIILYLDDILIATESVGEHIEILRRVFELSGRYRLQFRLDKCHFMQTEIKYLGYCIDQHGIRPSRENIESVLNYPIPRNVKEVQRFIGLASYFRRFIPGFSVVAKPLYDIIKKNATFMFGASEGRAVEALKNRLSSEPVLAIYSPQAETELHCDASVSGFGGILLQRQNDGTWRPVSFWSQRTTPAESRYHSFELECLAVVYAIKRFHVYLAGRKFRVMTDCDSFRLTLNKKDVNPRISRWALFLQNYDCEVVHRPGGRMNHVDALSRCHGVLVLEGSTFERTLAICQDPDEEIVKIRDELERGEMKHYELRDGLVYRKYKNKKLLFYVPPTMENNVIRTCHDDLGHVGTDKVFDNIIKIYWFPRMRDKIKEYILNCLRCIEFSPTNGRPEGYLHNIPKESVPFATIHIDHLGPLEKNREGVSAFACCC